MEDTYCFKKKRGTFLLSELNGIVYNFNANFACPIIKKNARQQYQKFKFLYRYGSIDY
jgi:hypothetical protein